MKALELRAWEQPWVVGARTGILEEDAASEEVEWSHRTCLLHRVPLAVTTKRGHMVLLLMMMACRGEGQHIDMDHNLPHQQLEGEEQVVEQPWARPRTCGTLVQMMEAVAEVHLLELPRHATAASL
jgi:hypothetical protein